ncbi:MAG: SCO family protein [Lentimicrobium sp.]|nr:SCO family protein [Lentimicrobium sp.]
MKTRTFLAILIILALFTSCKNKTETGSCCKTGDHAAIEKSTEISDQSVFLLDSEWENYRDEKKILSDYQGKVIVGAMIFTHCPSACPRLVADLKIIESLLTEDERSKVRFLLISMDPERDTPEQMRKFATDHRLNESWEMIRSDKASTMEIANVLGVRIKPLKDGGFDHSNVIQILNPEGEIVFQQQGLNNNPEESLEQIRMLL